MSALCLRGFRQEGGRGLRGPGLLYRGMGWYVSKRTAESSKVLISKHSSFSRRPLSNLPKPKTLNPHGPKPGTVEPILVAQDPQEPRDSNIP